MPVEESPLEVLRRRQESNARQRAISLVRRHGERMTEAERTAYSTALQSAPGPGLLPLRRRLHERLLRAYARRRTVSVAPVFPVSVSAEGVAAGPYNNLETVESALRGAAEVDPHWVAEFTALYSAFESLRRLCPKPTSDRH